MQFNTPQIKLESITLTEGEDRIEKEMSDVGYKEVKYKEGIIYNKFFVFFLLFRTHP